MIELVVVDNESAVIVSETATSAIIVSSPRDSIVVWGQIGPEGPQGEPGVPGPPGATTLAEIDDIDVTNASDGSILVYNASIQKWIAGTNGVVSVDDNTGVITSAQLFDSIKKEDGSNSGLDADLLDGLDSSSTNVVSTVMTRDNTGRTGIGILNLDTTLSSIAPATGNLWWANNDKDKTLAVEMQDGITQHVGQDIYFRVKADTTIVKGQVVMAIGTVGNSGTILAAPANSLTPDAGIYVLGIAAQTITQGTFGYVTQFGLIQGINTVNVSENWQDGTVLYLDVTIPGGLTKYIHTAPAPKVVVAMVVKAHQNGSIFVRVSHGSVLGGTDSNVEFIDLQDGDKIVYNSSLQRWENRSVEGTGLDQIITITKSLTMSTDWQDTGIQGNNLATGTYIMQLYANDQGAGGTNNNEYYSGTMSWYSGTTNSSVELPTDEIVLHRAGASSEAGMYLRTYRSETGGSLKLQIYSNIANPSASNYVFKFRRMI